MHLTQIRSILYRATFRLPLNNYNNKNIMTTPKKLQEILDELKGNPYYDKYAEKISKLQQTEPDKFKEQCESLSKAKTKKAEPKLVDRQYSKLLQPKEKIANLPQYEDKPLEKIMKIDLIKDKSAEEIQNIWKEYHMDKKFVCATIPGAQYDKLEEKSKKYPTFLFPLPRSQGYEFIMCQFERNSVHFTPLLYYQVHKENAPECLTIVHYTELKEDKGIVLMRGEYDDKVIDPKEAQCLVNQLELYYVTGNSEKENLLDTFTNKPDEFKHQELIKQIENLSL